MKRILEYKKLFNITDNTDLNTLKTLYRNLIKDWHPDKYINEEEKNEAEVKSKSIIEAYHFLVSISAETHAANLENYNLTTTTSGIDGFEYKGQVLKINFIDGSVYEYFGIPKNIYTKLVNSSTQTRFARRHIYNSYLHRNIIKTAVEK
jgi:DnaJ-class molecular chaperone